MADKSKFIRSIGFGVFFCLLLSIILICVFAVLIMSVGLLSADITDYIMLGVLSVSCLFGGFIAAKINKSQGFLCGLVTGVFVFILTTILGLARFTETITMLTLLRLIFTLLCGSIGGILGINQKERITIK